MVLRQVLLAVSNNNRVERRRQDHWGHPRAERPIRCGRHRRAPPPWRRAWSKAACWCRSTTSRRKAATPTRPHARSRRPSRFSTASHGAGSPRGPMSPCGSARWGCSSTRSSQLTNAARVCQAAGEVGATVTVGPEDAASPRPPSVSTRFCWRTTPPSASPSSRAAPAEDHCRSLASARVRLSREPIDAPASVAYRRGADIDRSYVRCLKVLMTGQAYPMIATHDRRLVEVASALAVPTSASPAASSTRCRTGCAHRSGAGSPSWARGCACACRTGAAGTGTWCDGWPGALAAWPWSPARWRAGTPSRAGRGRSRAGGVGRLEGFPDSNARCLADDRDSRDRQDGRGPAVRAAAAPGADPRRSLATTRREERGRRRCASGTASGRDRTPRPRRPPTP